MIIETLITGLLSAIPCCLVGAVPASILLVLVVAVAFGLKAKKGLERGFSSFAAETSLEFRAAGGLAAPEVSGEYMGRRVLVDIMKTSVESADIDDPRPLTVEYTRAQAWHKANVKSDILIRREGVATKISKALSNAKDVKIGTNKDFDRFYMVGCEDEAYAREVLEPGLQAAMVEQSLRLREVFLGPEYARCLLIGRVSDNAKLKALLDLAVGLAKKAQKSPPR